jgi:hypothetical protein
MSQNLILHKKCRPAESISKRINIQIIKDTDITDICMKGISKEPGGSDLGRTY